MRAQGRTVGRRVAVAILLIGSVLLGLFALHSMAGPSGSGLMAAMPAASIHAVSSAPNQAVSGGDPVVVTAAAVVAAATVASAMSPGIAGMVDPTSCTGGGPLDCLAAAMACVILFLLASVVFIAGGPAALRWLMDRAPLRAGRVPLSLSFFSAPSLVKLSISRT